MSYGSANRDPEVWMMRLQLKALLRVVTRFTQEQWLIWFKIIHMPSLLKSKLGVGMGVEERKRGGNSEFGET